MNGSDVSRALALLGGGSPASNLESQGIEFKTVSDSVKSTLSMLADASVCFINAEGGATVLGIDDKATERSEAVVGVPAAYTPDLVRKGIFHRTRPPITPLVSEEMVDGVRLLVITVPQGVLPHSNSAGLATNRLGSECLPFSPEQQREVMIARGYVDWSADSSGLDPRRLDQVELGRLRAFLTAAGREHLAELDTMALLSALRLLAADGSVTNAKYGSVSNRTLQRMFDIHVYAARDMLADLRKRGLIAKIGDAQGGKAVRYGPGPNFPIAAADGSVRDHRDREDQ